MTKQNSTLITMILDRSGSMESCRKGTVEGFNSFVESQKKSQEELNDEVSVSLIQFDTECEINYNMLPIKNVPNLNNKTFVPRGGTALLDAIGKTVNDVGSKLAEMPENERPSKVLVVIMTDGDENASRNFTNAQISEMIKRQERVYNWEFVYIGANQDSFAVGTTLGVKGTNTMNYSSNNAGAMSMYGSLARSVTGYKLSGKVDLDN